MAVTGNYLAPMLEERRGRLKFYAWAYQGEEGKEHYTAVLGLPSVNSPKTAVKAALVAKVKNEGKET